MRNFTSANLNVIYPDQLVFREDTNNIVFTNAYGSYEMTVTVTANDGLNTYSFSGESEIGSFTLRLSPFLRKLARGTTATFTVTVVTYDANYAYYTDTFTFTLVYQYGKTLQERHHGSSRVITYADASDMTGLEIYKPKGWTGTLRTPINVLLTDPEAKIVNITGNPPFNPKFLGTSPSPPVYAGDVWNEEKVKEWTLRLVQVCPPKDGIKLTYYDTDGCKRYAIGQVLSKKMAAKRDEFRRDPVLPYNTPPHSLLTGYSGTIDVGFADVDPLQYLEDIMLSPEVTADRGGDTIPLVPSTLTLTREGRTKDIVITFKIDA